MVTYLDLLNKARKKNNQDDISVASLSTNAQGSACNIEFVDEIVSDAYLESQDWGFNDIIVDVTTTSGTAAVSTSSLTTVWEPDAIKEVKYVKNNRKIPLYLLSPSKIDDIESNYSNAEPIYWYIDNQQLKLLPIPDAAYTLSIRYQGLIPNIDITNINSTIVIPRNLEKALITGIYSRLLHEDGDPEWEKWEARYFDDLEDALKRNRSNYKRSGTKIWRVKQPRSYKL